MLGGTVDSSYATGNVSGKKIVGGFYGLMYEAAVTNCFASGDATGSANYVGGFAGNIEFDDNSSSVNNCYSLGSAKGYNYVGGFAGKADPNGGCNNCYAKGNAYGNNYVGGFVGETWFDTYNNCQSDGEVKGTSNTGGFLGSGNINDTNSWNIQTSGQATSPGQAKGYMDTNMPALPTSSWDKSIWDLTGAKPELKAFNSGTLDLQTGSTGTNQYKIQNLGINYTGNTFMDVSTIDNARRTIETIDNMMEYYSSIRTKTGAGMNILNSMIDSNKLYTEGLTTSNSTIKDANIATESALLTKSQILQNFTATLLQQTNKLKKDFVLTLYGVN